MAANTPILISVPHSGIKFPEELQSVYKEEVLASPQDTDWFVDQLYDFAEEMNIEMVVAPYSRYVIDLNRSPDSQALYDDGRGETSLIPSTTFLGEPLLDFQLKGEEIQRRLDNYYWPYYKILEDKLNERVEKFGQALLFDAHSIKRNVASIQAEPFPDMILGDRDESTASALIIDGALNALGVGDFKVSHNNPFKGGNITRYFGNISDDIHALQLEMSQDLYMNEEETKFDEDKANKVRPLLRALFSELLLLME